MTGQPDRDERTGAELLREAARLMRERAEHVDTFGDSFQGRIGYAVGRGLQVTDDEYLASWHPAVALAVADLLDRVAELHDFSAPVECADYAAAIATARAYLAAPVSAGEPKEDA